MIEIDGSHGEGGGQILRTAIALAALSRLEAKITRIRANRPNPGLAAQHLAAVRAVAELSSATVEGLEIGSQEIIFRPGAITGGAHRFDVGTAGSVTLLLQACFPVAFAAPGPVQLEVIGGTDVRWSPLLDTFARVFLPWLQRLGADVVLEATRRGYYPKGGGKVVVVVQPLASWSPVDARTSGSVRRIRGIAHVSNLPREIPKRMRQAAIHRLQGYEDIEIEERVYTGREAIGRGGALVLWAETEHGILGASTLAERGKSAEQVGEEAAASLAAELTSGAGVDQHTADQLLIYLCQASGASTFTVRETSGHLRTMAWLLPTFFQRTIEIRPAGQLWLVTVTEPGAAGGSV